MTIAKAECGRCGAALSRDDKFCAHCGMHVEEAATGALREPPLGTQCRVCGHEVALDASYCESCGSALREGSRVQQQQQRAQKKNSKGQPSKGKRGKRFSLEPWQLITGAIVLALAAFFVYTEVTRGPATPKSAAQESIPAPNAGMLQEIEELQRAVDTNPNDAASLIRLANMLHDVGMHNQMFLNSAINTYSKYLKLKPADPNARVDMGICYYEMARMDTSNAPGLLSKAIEEMQKAFSVDPKHQPAAFNLGIVNLGAGNLEESNKWFNKAKEIDANSELGKKALQMLEQHSFQGPPN